MNVALLIILLAFVATIGLVSAFRTIAYRYHLLDVPNARSSHASPTPRGGGIGIVISFFVGIFLLHFLGLMSLPLLVSFVVGGILLACIGLLDDLHHVPARVRIFVHFIAGCSVLYILGGMPPLDLGFVIWDWRGLGVVVGLLGLVWLINLYNFMDGIDGLAGSEALFVAIAVAFLLFLKGDYLLIPVFLLLASAAGGFLIWNWSPARVFMGDTGSGFLGFVFGTLLIATTLNGALTPWQWLILLGCFWVDATLTLIHRVIRGEPWYQAHCSHAFQQAVKRTGCHERVVLRVLYINILWLLPIAILSIYFPRWTLFLTILAISPLIVLCILLKAGISVSHEGYDLLDTVTE
ncbi:MAG: glycosyltransferase family 4 protein [Gammaproteobacteria bacterium]|nr:glycosyltransferase family 4 protein [Gammaproteobacteria bacterium]